MLICTALVLHLIYYWRPRICPYIATGIISLSFISALILLVKVIHSPNGYLEYFAGHSWSGQRYLASGQPIGIVVRTDLFGALIAALVTGLGTLASIYSKHYIPHTIKTSNIGYYYCLLVLMIAGMAGICLTGDCFNFYVFLEVASISSYGLVAMPQTKQSLEAAFKYMVVGALGSILLVFGIVLLFSATGTLNMAYAAQQVHKIVTAPPGNPLHNFRHLVFASLGMFIIGLSVKSAFFPAHAWLADAHPAAPSSISALLSGLMVKSTGVFLFIRFLFTVFGLHKHEYGMLLAPLLMIIAIITIIGGSVFAIAQNDIKRMLAYSTVAQMGYILMGVSLISPAGLEGAILHIFNHALMKSLLFMSAGALIYKTGIRDIREMSRIGYRMPVTMVCFTVAAMSMIGIPPLNGFMSKWALAKAALDANLPMLVVVLLISSLLNAVYYFRVVGTAFFGRAQQHEEIPHADIIRNNHGHSLLQNSYGYYSLADKDRPNENEQELPWGMLMPLIILAAAILFFGVKVGILREIIRPAVQVLWR